MVHLLAVLEGLLPTVFNIDQPSHQIKVFDLVVCCRAEYSRNQTDVIATTRTSSWKGDVNLSRAVCSPLGIDQPDPEPSKYDDDDYTDT